MNRDTLVETYPWLWHMAHAGAWPAISKHGLLSVKALLDLYGIDGKERDKQFSSHRPQSVPIMADGLPGAVLRDQKPMSDNALRKCLQDGLEPKDWYEHLNSKSFFWLSRKRIWSLLRARAYKKKPQTVLTLATAPLVDRYHAEIWLSPMNSGATLYVPRPRGLETFKRIADFPYEERGKTRKPEANVVELLVDGGVPDIMDFVLAVHEVEDDKIKREIWRSPKAADDDHP